TSREEQLIAALRDSEARNETRKQQVIGLQATVVLQGMYVGRAHGQLQAQEEKAAQKRKNRVFGDGMPKLLTGDDFFEAVENHERKAAQEADKKARRQAGSAAFQAARAKWQLEEKARLERNRLKKAQWHAAVRDWE
ncbi:hypothetical protein CERSUDRAFT_35536, partial [Gelatoporia subvermispora B]